MAPSTSNALNNLQRRAICKYERANQSLTNTQLVEWVKNKFNIKVHHTAILKTLAKAPEFEGEIEPDVKRRRSTTTPQLDNTLIDYPYNR
jgi:hypothetical protein